MPEIKILKDSRALAEAAARQFTTLASKAITKHDTFSVALAGGSTPQGLYTCLANAPYVGQVRWQRVHLFWGDERCVSPELPDSNYRMVRESLLEKINIPSENIHRMPGELPPAQAAEAYETILRTFFSDQDPPRFDLILLGLGEDGHIASLFPASPALEENVKWVISIPHTQPPPPLVSRLTLTLPVFNAARQVIFLVEGERKALRLSEVLEGSKKGQLPAQLIQPVQGKLTWLVDQEAGAYLSAPTQ